MVALAEALSCWSRRVPKTLTVSLQWLHYSNPIDSKMTRLTNCLVFVAIAVPLSILDNGRPIHIVPSCALLVAVIVGDLAEK